MSRLKKLVLAFFVCMAVLMPCYADSLSLSTGINSVSQGVSGFGWGLFPVGTTFEYSKGFHAFDSLANNAEFSLELQFGAGTIWPSGSKDSGYNRWYDYNTGRPWWWYGEPEDTLDISYFRFASQLNTYLQQGFGINPVAGSGALVNVNLRWVSRYAVSAESLDVSKNGPDNAVFSNPEVFPVGQHIPAFPWLEGDRHLWNNNLSLSTYWYFRRGTSVDTYDGAYMDITLEAGPWWLGNSLFPDTVTSDYYKVHWSLEEYLTLFAVNQDNGWNWLNLMLGHSNSLGYTWGDVIPEHKIQTDRLRGYFTDSIWLRFTGPQFFATDCYPYFQISLNNSLAFGGVQNEISGNIRGVELNSSITFEMHLRLFGFIHVNYRFGYNFIKGFAPDVPNWWQDGQLGFYVSL